MSKILYVVLLSLFFCAAAYSAANKQTSNGYVTDIDLALRLSKETKQETLVIFSASWCKFCETLKEDIGIIKNLDNKIICILDVDNEKKLSRQFKIRNLPTSVILSASGNEIARIIGYDKKTYQEWIDSNK